MRHLFVSDGKLFSGNEADKLMIAKLEKLEKQVSILAKQLEPENRENEAIMKNLKNIKGTGL